MTNNFIKKPKSSYGFTILEVLITLGVLSIVLFSVTKLLTSNVKTVHETSKGVDYTQNLRIASNQILDQIKKENTMKASLNGTSLLYVDGNLILDTTPKATNTNNARLWVSSNGELRDSSAGSTKVIAEYIEHINIENRPNGNPYINIRVKVIDTPEAVLSIPLTYSISSTLPETPTNPNEVWENVFVYTNKILLEGSGKIIGGPDTMVILKANAGSSFLLSGGDTIVEASKIYAETKVVLDRGGRLGFLNGSSSIYVKGNVELIGGGPNFYGALMYTGTFTFPDWLHYSGTATKVPSIDLPPQSMPPLQAPSWYVPSEFVTVSSADSVQSNGKYKIGSMSFNWKFPKNVSLYSTGNITISGDSEMSGRIYAPNSKVTITGGSVFEGMIIAKEIVVEGGSIASDLLYAPTGKVSVIGGSKHNGIIIAKELLVNGNSKVSFQAVDVNKLPF